MSGAKEIRTKIQSIRNTQKITRAMEMVAASKMRKAQDRMRRTRPYAEKILQVIHHLAWGHIEYKHPFLDRREIKGVGFIVVSTDRGLCGGLNNNMLRLLLQSLLEWKKQQKDIKFSVFGRKAESFLKRLDVPIIGLKTHLGDSPHFNDIIGVVKLMLEQYEQGQIDCLYIAYNKFVNTMSQKPVVQQLLPLEQKEGDDQLYAHYWDYLYEPDAKELLDALMERYIESEVYQAIVENIACEQAARMVAMKNASDNAGELIKEFQLAYNKARQASITREIAEIVGGAAAV